LIYCILGIHHQSMNAQEVLTLDQAKKICIQNNYQLQLSKMDAEASSMQVYKSNAGITPRVDWNVNLGTAVNQVNQKFVDGRLIDRNGRTFAPSTNLALNWTLYDGNRMQTRYKILQSQSDATQIVSQDFEDNIANQVSVAYYNIVRQKETINFLKTIIKYYEERLTITKGRWEIGRGSKLDYLQSQNDLNTQLTAIQSAEVSLLNQKILLNVLITRDPQTLFDVEPLSPLPASYTFEEVFAKAIGQSEELMSIEKNIEINKLLVKELEGNKLPRIGLNSTLGYSLSNTNAGLILLNQNIGINAALTSTWNLYDGKHNKKQIQIGNYRTSIFEKEKEMVLARIKSEIIIAINQLESNKKTYVLEEENKKLAEENLNIALEKFKLGGSTILELNDAQQRYDNALNRHVNAFYNVKMAELEIERILR
jgi:outer membrane protein